MKSIHAALLLAVASSGTFALIGCEADDSLPRRPRVAVPADRERLQENAERRELEAPKRDLPTGGGGEFPGQSNASTESPTVVLLADIYGTRAKGPLPHLAQKPGTTPTSGFTPVPYTSMTVEHAWGEVLPLTNYNHRAWNDTKTDYLTANVKANPTYYINGSQCPKYDPYAGNTVEAGDAITTLIEIPWFFVNTAATPVLMIFQPPLAQVSPQRLGQDPLFFGYLPKSGDIVPSPTPGEYKFEYDFLKKNDPATRPQ